MRRFLLNRKLVWVVTSWAIYMAVPSAPLFAMPTGSVSSMNAEWRQAQIDKIMEVLSKPEAKPHLLMAGIKLNGLDDKLANLSDSQLQMVAQKADAVKAAGDAVLGLVIAILVIAILVVILLILLKTDIDIKDEDNKKK